MYCPNCGQRSASETLRFCRSCGFRLDGVAQLLAGSGTPMIAAPAAQLVQPKLRRKGVRTGAKLMFASAVLLPIAGALTIPADDPFPLFLPLIVFVAGLMRALYARLFEDPVLVIPLATRPAAESFRPAPVLPSSQHPSPTSQGVPDTSDLDQPPDVTERTTRLFNRQ